MKKDYRKLMFDLQLFADEELGAETTDTNEAAEDTAQESAADKPDEGGADEKQPKLYTDAEVDAIIARKKARWDAKHEKDVADAKAEAEKLAKMNKEQKEQYEKEQMEQQLRDQAAEIERLKANELRAELSKTAARQMKDDHNIIATQDMLDFVVGADAKSTNANIQKLVRIILDDRKGQEQKRATGSTPKSFRNDGSGAVDPYTAIANKYKK